MGSGGNGTVYCVKPDTDVGDQVSDFKGNRTCYTLSYYVNESSCYFTSDTTFIFSSGTFTLNDVINIYNVDSLALVGNSSGDSIVHCGHSSSTGLAITNSSNIVIQDMSFLRCGHSAISNYACSTLAFVNVTNLKICGATINESAGVGVYAFQIYGKSIISHSVFASNSRHHVSPASNLRCTSGNVFIVFKECPKHNSSTHLLINSSSFLFSYGNDSRGLYLQLEMRKCTQVHVVVMNSNFINNVNTVRDGYGGNIGIDLYCYTGFKENVIELKNNIIANGTAGYGGGLYVGIFSVPLQYQTSLDRCSYNLSVEGNYFIGNRAIIEGGGLFVTTSYQIVCSNAIHGTAFICNSTFANNTVDSGGYGAAAFVDSFLTLPKQKISSFEVTFKNCTFKHNHQTVNTISELPFETAGAVYVLEAFDGVKFCNCTFKNNKNTALTAVRSNMIFEGNITFLDNTGYDGGGVSLCSRSYIYFREETFVTFHNNSAARSGGGIYVAGHCPSTEPGCFFQFLANITQVMVSNSVRVIMDNNSAQYAGTAIYGGYVEHCYVFGVKGTDYSSQDVFHGIFNVPIITAQDLSPVSSIPTKVCFCNVSKLPDCVMTHKEFNVYPGEKISVSVVAVGEGEGVVPAVVVARPIGLPEEETQRVGKNCTDLKYTLYQQEINNFTLDIQKPDLQEAGHINSPRKVNATFKTCPIGFALKRDPTYCDCGPTLNKTHSKCHFGENGSPHISRYPGTWIGLNNITSRYNTSPVILTFSGCLPDYCNNQQLQLEVDNTTITNQNSQCAEHRVGILCGSCEDGYSVTSGSFDCRNCSDTKGLMIIFIFFLSGTLLVVFLFLCNLTISEGTINGLIFYVNVANIRELTVYSGHITSYQNMLRYFVRLMNLSYGGGVCLYDGMDVYVGVWLEYAFPFYVLFVTTFIILTSRWSTRISRLLGNNAHKVIATLFLLMYVKVLQGAIQGLSSATLHYESEDHETGTIRVWLYNGNIEFLRGRHIYLFAFSIIITAICFPYTLSLLFIKKLRKYSHLKLLHWVQRLMPFFDAYTGPYKNKCHFWPGLLLLARNVLLVVSAVNVTGDPIITLNTIITVCSAVQIVAWGMGGVYKRWPLDVLESFFFFNIIVMSLLVSYATHIQSSALLEKSIDTSVGISFLITILLILHHCYKGIRQSQLWAKCYGWFATRRGIWERERGQQVVRRPMSNSSGYMQLPVSQQESEIVHTGSASSANNDEMTEYSQLLSHDLHVGLDPAQ